MRIEDEVRMDNNPWKPSELIEIPLVRRHERHSWRPFMPNDRRAASSYECSKYLAMLNALSEVRHELATNGARVEARVMLDEVISLCRAEYEARFGS